MRKLLVFLLISILFSCEIRMKCVVDSPNSILKEEVIRESDNKDSITEPQNISSDDTKIIPPKEVITIEDNEVPISCDFKNNSCEFVFSFLKW